MNLFLKCNEAAHVCDKSQYKEASLSEKLKLKLHLLLCGLCRNHAHRNTKLSQTLKSCKVKTLPPQAKMKIETDFQEALKKDATD